MLNTGDELFYRDYTGVLNHNYAWKKSKVERVSKTLAYMDTGEVLYRKPISVTDGNMYRVKSNKVLNYYHESIP